MPGPEPVGGAARSAEDEGIALRLVYYGYVVGSALARALPERLAYRLAMAIGGWQGRRPTRQREIVARNLARITGLRPHSPELRSLVVAAYRSYARYWLETFRLVREGREFFLERFQLHGVERLDEVMARGNGAIVVVGHLGNWDAAGAWVGASGRRLTTVVEVLRPQRLFEFFAQHRARLGMTIYPARPGVTDRLVEEVQRGAVVAILGDRDLKGTGVPVDFFGEKTTFPPGPATVALRSDVPLLVAGVYGVVREGGKRGWEAYLSDIIELPADRGPGAVEHLSQQVADRLAGFIARRPEEWHVFQPLWPSDRG